MTPCQKNNIINIKEKRYESTSDCEISTIYISSKHSSRISMYMTKMVGDKRRLCWTLIFYQISSNQNSVVLNLEITFLCSLIPTTLNLRRTITSSTIFHSFVLRVMPKAFLKSMKEHKWLALSF